jgi:hypothetical protein
MKKRTPEIFGKYPILMQRYCGGLRIIYPDGRVEFSLGIHDFETTKVIYPDKACTQKSTQKESYLAAVQFDKPEGIECFLGYL